MTSKKALINRSLVISSLTSLVWMGSVVAQRKDFLTQAEMCKLKNVVELLRQQKFRPAELSDILKPKDGLKTATDALAEIRFNEGSLALVAQESFFYFRTGKREIDEMTSLSSFQGGCENNMALAAESSNRPETILQLDEGRTLIVSIPNSRITQIETPQSTIDVRASAPAGTAEQLPPLQQSGAVVVQHNANKGTTEVFALTDGDIEVSDVEGGQTVPLSGGQKVKVSNGKVGAPEEFSLETAYASDALLTGLGEGEKHDSHLAQAPTGVQFTLKLAQARTLEALRNQKWRQRQANWKQSFLGPGRDGVYFPPEGLKPNVESRNVINPNIIPGVFVRTGENTATFTDGKGNVTDISVDFDNQTITIDGQSGISNDAGLSGNNALGTVILDNGNVRRIEVFGVNGEAPPEQAPFQGTLTDGLAPDR